MTDLPSAGFPHSDISGSLPICGSPKLFAAYHVFHRLSVPRHPPCALLCLTFVQPRLKTSVACFVFDLLYSPVINIALLIYSTRNQICDLIAVIELSSMTSYHCLDRS